MKKLFFLSILFCIKNSLYPSRDQSHENQNSHTRSSSIQSINQNSHTRSNSIQSINRPRSTDDFESFQTTPYAILIDENAPESTRGYRSIDTSDRNNMSREDHEWLEKRTQQCKLCGIFSAGVGIIYFLISSIPK